MQTDTKANYYKRLGDYRVYLGNKDVDMIITFSKEKIDSFAIC